MNTISKIFIFVILLFAANSSFANVVVGDMAPEFTLATTNGDSITLSDLEGKVVLINFFHYYCSSCIAQAPQVQQTYEKFKDKGLVVIGIQTYRPGETVQVVLSSYVNPTGTTYPILMSGYDIGTLYGAAKEDYYVLDVNQEVVYRGHIYNQEAVENVIQDQLLTLEVVRSEIEQPTEYALEQNYPNPFNPQTTISFSIVQQQPTHVTLIIFDALGRSVRTLVREQLSNGAYSVTWDGRNENGLAVSSGTYYYALTVGEQRLVRRMQLVR